jgi:Uma2 family endonuclease
VAVRADSNNWTVERLQRLPNDGKRYEIIAGELFVTPAPALRHQYVVGELFAILFEYCRRVGLRVVTAPADVMVTSDTLVQPDVFAIPLDATGRPPATYAEMGRPILVVEVLSPSTTRVDRNQKRELYQSMQVPAYWIVDVEKRVLERWLASSPTAEVLRETLDWQPVEGFVSLEIDLAMLFRRVCGD